MIPSAVSPVTGSSYWLLLNSFYSPPNIGFLPFSLPSFWLRPLFFHFLLLSTSSFSSLSPGSILLCSGSHTAAGQSSPSCFCLFLPTQKPTGCPHPALPPFWLLPPSSLVYMPPSGQTFLPAPDLPTLLPFLIVLPLPGWPVIHVTDLDLAPASPSVFRAGFADAASLGWK